jgi:hypothetical protein
LCPVPGSVYLGKIHTFNWPRYIGSIKIEKAGSNDKVNEKWFEFEHLSQSQTPPQHTPTNQPHVGCMPFFNHPPLHISMHAHPY